jgi:uncharacterized membrane protein YhiD involved in acid resistance
MTPFELPWSAASASSTPAGLVIVDLLLAFVLGMAVAWLYTCTHRGLSYSRNMVHSLVLLCMIVCLVMQVVGDSVARAFGLVGALAIIRFRTVVRDARDTTFIFLALAIGIAVGVHQYATAVLGATLVGATSVLLQATHFAVRHADAGVLIVQGTADMGQRLDAVLDDYCRSHEALATRTDDLAGASEFTRRIRLFRADEQEQLLESIRRVPGATGVSIVLDEGAEEW